MIDWQHVVCQVIRDRDPGRLAMSTLRAYGAITMVRISNFGNCIYAAAGLALIEQRAEEKALALIKAIGDEFTRKISFWDREIDADDVAGAFQAAIDKIVGDQP